MKRLHPMRIDVEATQAFGFKDKRSYIRKGKIFRFGEDMTELRKQVFERSRGFCEMPINGVLSGRCQRNISWETGEMHHRPTLAQGGDDTPEGVLMICRRCHVAAHGRTTRWQKK